MVIFLFCLILIYELLSAILVATTTPWDVKDERKQMVGAWVRQMGAVGVWAAPSSIRVSNYSKREHPRLCFSLTPLSPVDSTAQNFAAVESSRIFYVVILPESMGEIYVVLE